MISDLRTMSHLELLVFSQVVRAGSITRAADELGIAKSAVSKHLARLEERLRVRLLIRSARRLSLTPEGEQLLPMVDSLIAETRRLAEVATEEISAPSGRVRFSASNEFGELLMATLMPEIGRQYPDIQVGLKLGYSFDDLQDPAFDLAFRIGSVNDDRLVSHPLGNLFRVLVASPDLPGLADLHEPRQLRDFNCMVFSSDEHEREWVMFKTRNPEQSERVTIRGRLSAFSFSALTAAAEAGAGIAYVPSFVAQRAIEQGTLVRVLPEWRSPDSPVFIAYRYGSHKIARIKAVIDLSRSLVPDILTRAGETN